MYTEYTSGYPSISSYVSTVLDYRIKYSFLPKASHMGHTMNIINGVDGILASN